MGVSITAMTVDTADAPPAGGTVTVTMALPHDMAATDTFSISNAHGFNAVFFEGTTYSVVATPTATSFTFTYTGADPTGAYTGGATVSPTLGGKLVIGAITYTNVE